MTKTKEKELLNSLQEAKDKIAEVEKALNKKRKPKKPIVNSGLEVRNTDVYILRTELHFTYDEIANALGITRAQVAESMKVLRDRGLVKSQRKAPTLIEDYEDEVKKLYRKKKNVSAIAAKLGISNKTVVRCLTRQNQ